MEDNVNLKVGALAAQTGLTVRTLHHYDEIGLLSPARNASGHRVYGAQEVSRLQQIASLRHLGISLEDIRRCIDRPGYTLDAVLALQLERIEQQIERQEQMRALIGALRARLGRGEDATVEELTRTIAVTVNIEKYFSAEQRRTLAARRNSVGDERIEEVQKEWAELFAEYHSAMRKGLDPSDAPVLGLARRSASLIAEFTGGDPGVAASLGKMYRHEGGPRLLSQHGTYLPDGLWEYMGRAREALAESDRSGEDGPRADAGRVGED